NMNSSWATQDPPGALWFEQVMNAGVYIATVTYAGLHIVIFSTCAYYLIQERNKQGTKCYAWLTYIVVLSALGTINLAVNIHFNELAWIDERNYPGGPLAFLMQQEAIPVNTVGNVVGIIADFMADSLLLYRVYVLWQKWYIIVLPILMLTANTGKSAYILISCIVVAQAALPGDSLWSQNTFDFSMLYWSMSMSLNIILTATLVSRLLWMRRQIVQVLGPQHSRTYTSIAAMIVESALPYALVSFVFVVLYGLQDTAFNLFLPVLTQVECISPMLVILRVARGHALSQDTVAEAMVISLRFHDKDDSTTTALGSNRTRVTLETGSILDLRGTTVMKTDDVLA
ncbi:hypothetical protein CERSUDRAFT_47914, partial [Gelatoporia subvermispora B]